MPRRTAPLLALIVALALPTAVLAEPGKWSDTQRETLTEYARDTWTSFTAMVHPETGLAADQVREEGPVAYTSPTNIGAYLWSTVLARDVGFITKDEAIERVEQTLHTLAGMDRHHGMFVNWYDPATGEPLTTWPTDDARVYQFLSSVDNGWLAVALHVVGSAIPQVSKEADAILADMNFGFYYDPAAGLLRGGAWVEQPPGCAIETTLPGDGGRVWFTCHHYGALNTEPRIASYLGIAAGDVPASHYFKMWRTFPATCDWSWQEMRPEGVTRTYEGVDVFEGTYEYRGKRLVPAWGGSMFEALMVPLFVPEAKWAPDSWGVNHPLFVQAQIEHGLEEADYGYWGFSPSNNPDGGYREYGVDPIGLDPAGYTSDQQRTTVDYGFEGCREGAPLPESYGDGVVTPHAAFLALAFDPGAALENLANLRADFDAYSDTYGFYDAIEVTGEEAGKVARQHLALDQGMIMAALGNALLNDRVQRYFVHGEFQDVIQPLIAQEQFESGPAS